MGECRRGEARAGRSDRRRGGLRVGRAGLADSWIVVSRGDSGDCHKRLNLIKQTSERWRGGWQENKGRREAAVSQAPQRPRLRMPVSKPACELVGLLVSLPAAMHRRQCACERTVLKNHTQPKSARQGVEAERRRLRSAAGERREGGEGREGGSGARMRRVAVRGGQLSGKERDLRTQHDAFEQQAAGEKARRARAVKSWPGWLPPRHQPPPAVATRTRWLALGPTIRCCFSVVVSARA